MSRSDEGVPAGAEAVEELRRFSAGSVLMNEAMARRMQLSAGDFQAADLVQTHGPLTPTRLAELTGLTGGAVTALVDRLERAGVVRRRRDADDRRRTFVEMTDASVRDIGRFYGSISGAVAGAFEEHPAAHRRAILQFLHAVNAALDDTVEQIRAE